MCLLFILYINICGECVRRFFLHFGWPEGSRNSSNPFGTRRGIGYSFQIAIVSDRLTLISGDATPSAGMPTNMSIDRVVRDANHDRSPALWDEAGVPEIPITFRIAKFHPWIRRLYGLEEPDRLLSLSFYPLSTSMPIKDISNSTKNQLAFIVWTVFANMIAVLLAHIDILKVALLLAPLSVIPCLGCLLVAQQLDYGLHKLPASCCQVHVRAASLPSHTGTAHHFCHASPCPQSSISEGAAEQCCSTIDLAQHVRCRADLENNAVLVYPGCQHRPHFGNYL